MDQYLTRRSETTTLRLRLHAALILHDMQNEMFTGDMFFSDKPWKEVSPEEYIARNWLRYDCLDVESMEFKNKKLKAWANRVGEIFNDHEQLKQCRETILSEEEKKAESGLIEKVRQNGI